MPFAYKSNNAIPPAQTLMAFLVSVVAGARLAEAPTGFACLAAQRQHRHGPRCCGFPNGSPFTDARRLEAYSGFFDNTPLSFLEVRTIPYIVVARLTKTIKHKAAGLAQWTPIDDQYAYARFTLQLHGWAKPREFFAIRERARENKAAVGRRLIDVEGYTFRVFVTNRAGGAADLWRDYNQRACVEQHSEELKNDLQADGFCMRNFFATECAFLSVCFTYNLLSLYQHAAAPERRKSSFQCPATLRAAVFIGGAILGKWSRKPVLYIAESWGGLSKRKPLIDNILNWKISTSPKLPPDPPGGAPNGGSNEEKTRAA